MSSHKKKITKWVAGGLGILALGQVAFWLSQNETLKGFFASDVSPKMNVGIMDEAGNVLTGLTITEDFTAQGAKPENQLVSVTEMDGYYELTFSTKGDYITTVHPEGYVSESVTKKIPEVTLIPINLDFGHKITVLSSNGGTAVTDATVSIDPGSGTKTSCINLGDGNYGCAVPVSTTAQNYIVSKSGYFTATGTFESTRDSNDDPTVTTVVTLQSNNSSSPTDTDGDGLSDKQEITLGTDPNKTDTDEDKLPDGMEIGIGTSPTTADTDGGGIQDGREVIIDKTNPADSSDDKTPSTPPVDEEPKPQNPDVSGNTDTDADGLNNAKEATEGTSPTDEDSDDDGLKDGAEVLEHGTDPLNPDTDDGGITDGKEIESGTDPLKKSDDKELVDHIIGDADYLCEDPFTDTLDHWAEEMICRLYNAEIIIGRSSTLFYPNSNITRAEWLKIILLNAGEDVNNATGLTSSFSDVNPGDWFYPYVTLAEKLDVVRTRDFGDILNPNKDITRADAVLWAIRLAEKTDYDYEINFSDVNEDSYFAYAVAIAQDTIVNVPNEGEKPIIEGYEDGTFHPYSNILRSEAVAVALRIHQAWYGQAQQ